MSTQVLPQPRLRRLCGIPYPMPHRTGSWPHPHPGEVSWEIETRDGDPVVGVTRNSYTLLCSFWGCTSTFDLPNGNYVFRNLMT